MDHSHMGHNMPSSGDHGNSHHSTHMDDMDMGDGSSNHTMEGMSHGLMYFHFGYHETILFESWKVSSVGTLIGSMIGIFIMAALYEGLKYYREYLFWRTCQSLQYNSVPAASEKEVVKGTRQIVQSPRLLNAAEMSVRVVGEVIHGQPSSMCSRMHLLQTFLHVVQIVVSYFLMLIFMTYNAWLCISVVFGAAVGFFLFGWKKSVIVDVTEHCH